MKRLAAALYIMMCSSLAHGATLLFSDDFEGVNPLSTKYTGCTSGTTPIGNVTISTSQAHGGTHSAFYRGDGSGAGHDQTSVCYGRLTSASNRIYISLWMYFTPGFGSAAGHGWRIYQANGGNVPNGAAAQFDGGPVGNGNTIAYAIDPINDPTRNIAFDGALTIPVGQWARVEMEYYQGTGANGMIRAWWTDSGGLHKWANPSMTGFHHDCDACSVDGCTGCHWPNAMQLDLFALATNLNVNFTGPNDGWFTDDIQIWDGCPGSGNYACVSGGGTDTTPPAAPRNVRVL